MPPIFGLNFIEEKEFTNKNFMLLCGFEKFDNYFVRIDILERLFIKIISTNKDNNEVKKEIKLVPDMLNLLGCKKESFIKLIQNMDYKTIEKDKEIFFKYNPNKTKPKKFKRDSQVLDNPFNILKNINFR